MVWINAIIQGVLVGGLYALFATGLSLAFGVMRFVNLDNVQVGRAAGVVPPSTPSPTHRFRPARRWR